MRGRVFRKRSLQQEDRLPVSSYEEAVRRLVIYREDQSITDEAYHLAVELTADIFWRADKAVLRDVMIAARDLG